LDNGRVRSKCFGAEVSKRAVERRNWNIASGFWGGSFGAGVTRRGRRGSYDRASIHEGRKQAPRGQNNRQQQTFGELAHTGTHRAFVFGPWGKLSTPDGDGRTAYGRGGGQCAMVGSPASPPCRGDFWASRM
ncbi:unnamed protein product, partial [Ectocarpus sp. 12 AP-2014]